MRGVARRSGARRTPCEGGSGIHEDWIEAARWYTKSAAQDHAAGQFSLGRAQARYFAQHLLSRGNFVGFRDEQEEAHVIAGKLRTGLLWEERRSSAQPPARAGATSPRKRLSWPPWSQEVSRSATCPRPAAA